MNLINHTINRKVTIAPLVTFRILFGLLMMASIMRFWAYGWIEDLYILPSFYFPFVEGIRPIPGIGMYIIFGLMALAALFVTFGLFYRYATICFFLLFTYVELIDKTNYLNHYYFISLISFLMIFIPAHKAFSLDARRKNMEIGEVSVLYVNMLRLQMGMLYFFAGIAKINPDWLMKAQPLKMWLSANVYQPVIGPLFQYKISAYIFSWFGMLYDITIPFFLSFRKTVYIAYVFVIGFHFVTWWLFPIGMFPWIMMVITTVFFPASFHDRLLSGFKTLFRWHRVPSTRVYHASPILKMMVVLFFVIQLTLPFRYLLYPGNLFWTEEGYRFSWRVMLMEKAGNATFYVKDKGQKKAFMVPNYEYLTPQQEKMMATQPDMILQYAHYLEEVYQSKGMTDPVITADVQVTLNGQPSRQYIDPSVDLTELQDTWKHKNWILNDD